MKGSVLGRRATKLAFIVITLIFTTLFLWGWDKTPFLGSFLPQSENLRLSPDILTGSLVKTGPSEPKDKDVNYLSNPAKNKTSDNHDEYNERSSKGSRALPFN